jgi:hypothetical protein
VSRVGSVHKVGTTTVHLPRKHRTAARATRARSAPFVMPFTVKRKSHLHRDTMAQARSAFRFETEAHDRGTP